MDSIIGDGVPSTPGKMKVDRPHYILSHRSRWQTSVWKLAFWSALFLFFIFLFFARSPSLPDPLRRSFRRSASYGGPAWEKRVRSSAHLRRPKGISVLVTGAAGFVGSHVSVALKRRGDGVLGLDNFNDYYDPSLKFARRDWLEKAGVFVVVGDVNDADLLRKLFDVVKFTHVMHLAAQAGVRYAMKNPASYVHSNIAGFVNLLEVCKSANPQPAIVWASSSSVYGLSITGLRFFTVYGPWGRPDMAYFFFTKDILQGKKISIYEGLDHETVARDFTYIDDVVQGCLASLDTAGKSTGSGGKKKGAAQLRIFNLGNTSPVPVSDLVSILERLLKSKAKRVMMKMPRNGDVMFTHANISLAQQELNYHPTTDLQTGLKRFVKWYLQYHGGKSSIR